MNCNLYKVQIGKLQSVYHLHLLQFFLTEFSKTLFSVQTSSESLVSLQFVIMLYNRHSRSFFQFVIENVQDFFLFFKEKCARFFEWLFSSICFIPHARAKVLEIVKTRTHNLWMVSIIFENLDPRVLLLCYESVGYTCVSEVPY